MKIPYFCCIGAELKRYTKDFDFMNQVYLYKVPTDDSIEEVLSEDYFNAISDSVLQDDLVYIYEASEDTLHSCKFDKQNGHITAVPLASDETLTGAVTTIIHDNLTKNRAVISNNDGKIAVSEVTTTELGYLSGATSNIQEQLNEKAKTDLSNLTSAGKNIGLWCNNAANIITEIPQNINLTLSDGTLTLKAGSKCYLKTDTTAPSVTVASDLTTTQTTDGAYFVIYDGSALTTVLTTAYTYATLPDTYSLPLGVVTVSSGAISSIDNVFNGFGYIGSQVFTLPGVKGLYPNGRNTDGTLKNGTIECTTIQISSVFNDTGEHCLLLQTNGRCQWYLTNQFYYIINDNTIHSSYNDVKLNAMDAGTFTTTAGVISNFAPKTVFHAVDYNDYQNLDAFVKNYAMGAPDWANQVQISNGTTITENGYVYAFESGGDMSLLLSINGNTVGGASTSHSGSTRSGLCAVGIGDVVTVSGSNPTMYFVPIKYK